MFKHLFASKPRGQNFIDLYPPRWWFPLVNIYGGKMQEIVYMTRLVILPRLYLHIFWRPDGDRDPHDHPFGFWTLPINQGYVEEVYDSKHHCFIRMHAPRLTWSHRGAKHTHRVIETDNGRWPLITLVWRGDHERPWGFWCHAKEYDGIETVPRYWVPNEAYTNSNEFSNVPGIDLTCPGRKG